MSNLSNFIYIGTSKAGSTWLFDLLSRHADVFVTPSKGLYFFDHHFDNGWQWYHRQFAEARQQSVIAEISHSYLYSQLAAERVREMNPNIRLMVCLREPVDRAFSMYLDGLRNGKWSGSFEDRSKDTREIFQEGCYADYLPAWLERFPREQIHISLFDDLRRDPVQYAQQVFDFLQLPPLPFDERLSKKVMPAGLPRNESLVRLSKRASAICRTLGLKKFRGRVKRSRMIRSLLYREVKASDRVTLSEQTRNELRERFRPHVDELAKVTGLPIAERWGYADHTCSVAAMGSS